MDGAVLASPHRLGVLNLVIADVDEHVIQVAAARSQGVSSSSAWARKEEIKACRHGAVTEAWRPAAAATTADDPQAVPVRHPSLTWEPQAQAWCCQRH